MSPTLWVRSKWNEQARDEEKLKVQDVNEHYYQCVDDIHGCMPYLLKSHYVPCEAPVVLEKVEVTLVDDPTSPGCPDLVGDNGERLGYVIIHSEWRKTYRVVSLVVERRKG